MGIAVVLYFDKASEQRIRNLWSKLAKKGIDREMIDANARPHLSLGAFEGVDSAPIIKRVRENFTLCAGQTIEFTSVASFLNDQGVVYLAPRVTLELFGVHGGFHELFADLEQQKVKSYTPQHWVPHCTLALNIPRPKVLQVMDTALNLFQPFQAELTGLGFVEFYPIRYLYEQDVEIC